MPEITIYPLGNADTTRIDLAGGEKLLVDYADVRDDSDDSDKRIDLHTELRRDLRKKGRDDYDVVAFTHLDRDHICGSSEFFYLRHAEKYQGEGRVRIQKLWVPAAAILETNVKDEAQVIRAEARHRLVQGEGIRVFSSPGLLDDWLRGRGIDPASRQHLITNAGETVPEFTLEGDGAEFFIHSPFATRSEQGQLINRNSDALAFQVTFEAGGRRTRAHFFSDLKYDDISRIVRVTEYHAKRDPRRLDRLKWDIFHLSHHCSYTALGPEKGRDKTRPEEKVDKLYKTYGEWRATLISTSNPIPNGNTDQPPHRQAAAYYREVADELGGAFLVTMKHPLRRNPKPIRISIDGSGATVEKVFGSGVGVITSQPAPRAGGKQ